MIGKLWAVVILGVAFGPAIVRAADDEIAPPPLQIVISVAEQKLAVVKDGGLVRKYAISTSKFGLGDTFNSYRTPLGRLRVCDKFGEDLPLGAVLKSRNATGEILPVNSPGRDPIVTRILWLEGLESGNSNARSRGIYIHGTVEESKLGQPVSYGCIRMRSRDVVEIFESTPVGTPVEIITEKLPQFRKATPKTETLFASNDNIVTTFGPRGMVIVRTTRPNASAAAKPATTPEPSKLVALKPAPKTPEPAAKIPEAPAKTLVAKTPPPPPPTVDGPTVLLTTSRSTARLPIPPTKKLAEPVADEPRVILISGSMLTADLDQMRKPVPLPTAAPAPERVAVAAPTAVLEVPAGPRLLALDLTSVSFELLDDLARPVPIDAFTHHLLHPPAPEMRLAFRAPKL